MKSNETNNGCNKKIKTIADIPFLALTECTECNEKRKYF